ncbi:MAG: hypothetical protein OWU33_09730 [Firmicutes bacterium]|nr:hypothetical protein [Bacillota bacterium]
MVEHRGDGACTIALAAAGDELLPQPLAIALMAMITLAMKSNWVP